MLNLYEIMNFMWLFTVLEIRWQNYNLYKDKENIITIYQDEDKEKCNFSFE